MDAHYYSFDPTGNKSIDKILSAVACAGKAFHNTYEWNTDYRAYPGHTGKCPIDWIQNAAEEAAKSFNALRKDGPA